MIKMSQLLMIFFFFSKCRLLHCHLCRGQFVLNTWQEQEQNKPLKQWERKKILHPVARKYLRGQVTARQVGGVAAVLHFAAHNVVAVVTLWDLILRIYTDLWGAISQMYEHCTYSDKKKKSLLNSKTRGEDKFYIKVKDLWTVWE